MINAKPTWNDDILPFFTEPFWLPKNERASIVERWHGCMVNYGLDLLHYADVKQQSVTIYNHLASKSMPLTSDERQFWPIDALETFRHWVNQGCRYDQASAFDHNDRIATPSSYQPHLLVRKDINSLSDIELNRYRAALDDIMQVANASPDSPWQRFGYIHTNWCLHYQEAFAFWHRGYLMQLEQQIGMAIPYWDWMAIDASVDGSDQAGLPLAFLEETYQHPTSGETRPNPLRFAAAKDGCSKACSGDNHADDIDCAVVQRNPLFYTRGKQQQAERQALFSMVKIFQQQVVDALKFENFSTPQGVGHPWANIPNFTPPQPDQDYRYRDINFDGLYEQPHDNYHGWVGGDMADNAYTAFDPIFYSFHANIDRMLEVWLRNHPQAQFSAGVALRPFSGATADSLEFSTPDLWRYTSIGQLAQDCRRIGYDFGPPVAAQFGDVSMPQQGILRQSHEPALSPKETAWIAFDHVRCTHDSYVIDVFINQPSPCAEDCTTDNPHFVGRFSRIGMGMVDQNNRCITQGVSRYLNASNTVAALGLSENSTTVLSTRVSHLESGQPVSDDEQQSLPGFAPVLVWGSPQATTVSSQPTPSCCATA